MGCGQEVGRQGHPEVPLALGKDPEATTRRRGSRDGLSEAGVTLRMVMQGRGWTGVEQDGTLMTRWWSQVQGI